MTDEHRDDLTMNLDHHSEAAQIIAAKRPWLLRMPFYLIVLFFACTVGWSLWHTIDVTVTATGLTRPTVEEVEAQCMTQGKIILLAHKVGDTVNSGDLLFEIENRDLLTQKDLKEKSRDALNEQIELQQDRLKLQQDQYTARQSLADKNIRLARLDLTTAQKDKAATLRTLKLELKLAKANLKQLTAQIGEKRELLKNKHITKDVLDALLDKLPATRFEVERVNEKINTTEKDKSREDVATMKITVEEGNRKNNTLSFALIRQDIEDKLAHLKQSRTQVLIEIEALKTDLRNTRFTAPHSGVITEQLVRHTGTLLNRGDTVYRMVPSNSPLIVHVMIPNKDRAGVHLNQKANLKLDAFPFREHGLISGEVTYISPDSTVQDNGMVVYRAHVQIKDQRGLDIKPGMSLEADIVKKQKTVMKYLIDKLLNVLDE